MKYKAAKTIQKAYKKYKKNKNNLKPIIDFMKTNDFKQSLDDQLESMYDHRVYLEEQGMTDEEIQKYYNTDSIIKAITGKDKKFKKKIIKVIENLEESEVDYYLREISDEKFGIYEIIYMIKHGVYPHSV